MMDLFFLIPHMMGWPNTKILKKSQANQSHGQTFQHQTAQAGSSTATARVVDAETLQSFHQGAPKKWQHKDRTAEWKTRRKKTYMIYLDCLKIGYPKIPKVPPSFSIFEGLRLGISHLFRRTRAWLQSQVPVQLSASLRMRSNTKSTISLPIV